jgi:formylglycine-generating enzyme required for sulfatase activity
MRRTASVVVYWLSLLGTPSIARADVWPPLSPIKAIGGGAKDAALIVGAEHYAFVAPVPGARANAVAWHEYLTSGRGVPVERVHLLQDQEATREKLLRFLTEASREVLPGGTLWVVFIGHGAPAPDGKDGLLVGIDAQQEADSLVARSLRRSELLERVSKSTGGRAVVVLDACFSGRAADGKPLVPGLQPLVVTAFRPAPAEPTQRARLAVLTAAAGNEFAGPLPGSGRPAFSYLVLGGLRGWADADGNGTVTAAELHAYATRVLRSLLTDRSQTPSFDGDAGDEGLGAAWEKGPDLGAVVRALRPSPVDPGVPTAPAPTGLAPTGMVVVSEGPFLRGSPDGDADERPARRISLRAFAIDRTEVTQAQYAACVGAGKCAAPDATAAAGATMPVTGVSWHDAKAYCEHAGKRLPTEAEWEKAARGPEGRVYPWGAELSCLRANYDVCGRGGPSAVGSLPDGASPYGALDLGGNVWEWVADWYSPATYAEGPERDPAGPAAGAQKVIRGGAFDTMAATVRSSYRGRAAPATRHRNVGFRCAKDL